MNGRYLEGRRKFLVISAGVFVFLGLGVVLLFILMGTLRFGCDERKAFDKVLDEVRLRIKFIPTRYWPYARYEVVCPGPKEGSEEHILYATVEGVEESTPWGTSIISARSFWGEELKVRVNGSNNITVALPYVNYIVGDFPIEPVTITNVKKVEVLNGITEYFFRGMFSFWVFSQGDIIRIYFTDDTRSNSGAIIPDQIELIGIRERFVNR